MIVDGKGQPVFAHHPADLLHLADVGADVLQVLQLVLTAPGETHDGTAHNEVFLRHLFRLLHQPLPGHMGAGDLESLFVQDLPHALGGEGGGHTGELDVFKADLP